MTVKTLTITEEAYRKLARLKRSGESFSGVAQFARPNEERARILGILGSFATYPLDGPAADEAGRIYGSLRAGGNPIGVADALIAAIALLQREPLITRNRKEFGQVE